MPFCYLPSHSSPLRQGEIIENLLVLKPKLSFGEMIDLSLPVEFDPTNHPYSIVVSQDCDLEWDYKARHGEAGESKLLGDVLFCDLFTREEIKLRGNLGQSLFDRVKINQDLRYHRLEEALVGETEETLPELFADFKAIFSLSVEFAYALTLGGQATRKGFLPSPYVQDFMQRLYAFLGRVATPE